jgi:hypothetical protein
MINVQCRGEKEHCMRKEPDTPMGTVVLIGIFLILTVALWFNAYFVVLSRGAN